MLGATVENDFDEEDEYDEDEKTLPDEEIELDAEAARERRAQAALEAAEQARADKAARFQVRLAARKSQVSCAAHLLIGRICSCVIVQANVNKLLRTHSVDSEEYKLGARSETAIANDMQQEINRVWCG